MNTVKNPFCNLCAEDIMSRDVVVVTANSTMSEAADILSENQISGAPVVDEFGHCIGVLSGTDYVHSKASYLEFEATHQLSTHTQTGSYEIEDVLHDLVRRHMTPAVQTVDRKCSLLQAARCMGAEHMHRLIVIDESGVPVGIITSLDLIAVVVDAATTEQTEQVDC